MSEDFELEIHRPTCYLLLCRKVNFMIEANHLTPPHHFFVVAILTGESYLVVVMKQPTLWFKPICKLNKPTLRYNPISELHLVNQTVLKLTRQM